MRKLHRILLRLILAGLLLLSAGANLSVAETRHAAVRVLSSDRLQVEVMEPNAPDRYYRGIRFSPVADVLRVVMDGHDFLFSPVAHDPLQENGGLAMEFDLFEKEFAPPGFTEAKEGEGFVKVGVGVLKKTGEKYNCATPYELIEAARTTVDWKKDSAEFRQICDGTNGYAYVLDVTVQVAGAGITVDYRLKNTGSKELRTEQYAHNFFRFDEQKTGPACEVIFPYDFTAEILKPVIEKKGQSLILTGEITPKIKAAQAHLVPKDADRKTDSVRVVNREAGMEIQADFSKPSSRITVHAAPDYLSPEQFYKIRLQPGETADWTRSYRFKMAASISK